MNKSRYPRYKNGMEVEFSTIDDTIFTGVIIFVGATFVVVFCKDVEKPNREKYVGLDNIKRVIK